MNENLQWCITFRYATQASAVDNHNLIWRCITGSCSCSCLVSDLVLIRKAVLPTFHISLSFSHLPALTYVIVFSYRHTNDWKCHMEVDDFRNGKIQYYLTMLRQTKSLSLTISHQATYITYSWVYCCRVGVTDHYVLKLSSDHCVCLLDYHTSNSTLHKQRCDFWLSAPNFNTEILKVCSHLKINLLHRPPSLPLLFYKKEKETRKYLTMWTFLSIQTHSHDLQTQLSWIQRVQRSQWICHTRHPNGNITDHLFILLHSHGATVNSTILSYVHHLFSCLTNMKWRHTEKYKYKILWFHSRIRIKHTCKVLETKQKLNIKYYN